jgi:hypothetical protein
LEKIFPMVGKNASIFPMIGKIFHAFSNDWKKFSRGAREGFQPQRTQRTQSGREKEWEECGRREATRMS